MEMRTKTHIYLLGSTGTKAAIQSPGVWTVPASPYHWETHYQECCHRGYRGSEEILGKSSYCSKRLTALHQQTWKTVQWMERSKETKNWETSLHRQQQAEFVENLENLFDIAHADALSMIKIPEDRAFLLAQREKGWRGVMGPVDQVLAATERRVQEAAKRKKKGTWRQRNMLWKCHQRVKFPTVHVV